MSDDRKKQVQQRIAKDVAPLLNDAVTSADAGMKDVKEAIADVDAALKDTPDARIVDGAERELVLSSRNGGKVGEKFGAALQALNDATKDDDDFQSDQAEIKEIRKKLALKLQSLKESLDDADKRKQAIAKWRAGFAKDDKAASQSWILLGDQMASDENEMKKAAKAVDTWVASAEKAAKAKDSASLKKLQASPPPLDVSQIKDGKYSAGLITSYAKRFEVKALSKELQARIAKEVADFKNVDKRLQKIAVDYAAAKVKVGKLK